MTCRNIQRRSKFLLLPTRINATVTCDKLRNASILLSSSVATLMSSSLGRDDYFLEKGANKKMSRSNLRDGEIPTRKLTWKPLVFLIYIMCRTIDDRFPIALWEVWFCSSLGVPIPVLIGPSQ